MDKRITKIKILLAKIHAQIDELLANESTEDMSAEEILVLATELTTSSIITTIEYTSPVATIDRTQVSFDLGDDYAVPLFGDEHED